MTEVIQCDQSIAAVEADAVIAGYFTDQLPSYANELSVATEDFIGNLMNNGDFDAKPNEVLVLPYPAGILARRLVLVGLGEASEFSAEKAFQAAGSAAKSIASKPREKVALFFPESFRTEAIAGSLVGSQGQDILRSEKKITPFGELLVSAPNDRELVRGKILGQSMNCSRNLVNQPANLLYPETLADAAVEIGKSSGFEVEVWDEARLQEEQCRTLLAVAEGSSKSPRMLIMRYRGGDESKPTLALVGKGVTFDSGGYSLKPSEAMFDMKCDMGGAATVIGAIKAIAELNLPVNVTGYCGVVENMVSGSAFKLGDVIRSRNGKTVEIHNTDAEGRLVLADVLDVAVKDGVDQIVDFATLTGACLVALGLDCAGVFTNRQSWCDQFTAASREAGEETWQLPMTPNFAEQIKSEVADIKNMGKGRWGGSITAAKFLEEFVSDVPWIHVDIAGPAWSDSPKKWIDAGGSGCFVRTLVQLAENL
ncbi:MAG: leucyl aminopeptidase [Planctomycetota bacterium]|nr:leucyl aminopeptidase [Planctomycetota bacterium]